MNTQEIIKLKILSQYLYLNTSDFFYKFFNKSLLHNIIIMEIFLKNNIDGISFEKLCLSIPKSLGSRSTIQSLLKIGLDKKIINKIVNKNDKRIKNYFLSGESIIKLQDWVKKQKIIFNS